MSGSALSVLALGYLMDVSSVEEFSNKVRIGTGGGLKRHDEDQELKKFLAEFREDQNSNETELMGYMKHTIKSALQISD
jgi:hypothetical protein